MEDDKRTAGDKRAVKIDTTTYERMRRGGEPIPVAELRFVGTNGLEVPGPGAHRIGKIIAGVPAGSATGNGKYTVEFWPWMRHHCVAYLEDARPPVAFLVHETHVASWIPG
jgi:hypothetical protein